MGSSHAAKVQEGSSSVITQLQKDILALEGFKPIPASARINMGWGPIDAAFPNNTFPTGAVHEFLCGEASVTAATCGFVSTLSGALMKQGGATVWIGSPSLLYAPGLKFFGVEADRIIFVNVKKDKDILWVMEESLKCQGLAAVIGEINAISFTDSRRLQLAVEHSRVTGFILNYKPQKLRATACVSRWQIEAMASEPGNGMPGVGFPRWKVELLKIRNGRPGSWEVEWTGKKFRQISKVAPIITAQQKKTG